MFRSIIFILIGFFFLVNFGDESPGADESATGLSIIYTNDINGYLEPCG